MTAVGPCKRLTALMTLLMAILYPPHTLQCDLAASPIKSGNLFPHSLNLSWPCDLLLDRMWHKRQCVSSKPSFAYLHSQSQNLYQCHTISWVSSLEDGTLCRRHPHCPSLGQYQWPGIGQPILQMCGREPSLSQQSCQPNMKLTSDTWFSSAETRRNMQLNQSLYTMRNVYCFKPKF